MRPLALPLVVVVVAALVGVAPAAASRQTGRLSCRQITVRLRGKDFSYRIVIASGRVTCDTARRVIRVYIAKQAALHGWICFRGHSRDPWSASCARVSPPVVVRAYLIAG